VEINGAPEDRYGDQQPQWTQSTTALLLSLEFTAVSERFLLRNRLATDVFEETFPNNGYLR
jgi:hypothetical protein